MMLYAPADLGQIDDDDNLRLPHGELPHGWPGKVGDRVKLRDPGAGIIVEADVISDDDEVVIVKVDWSTHNYVWRS